MEMWSNLILGLGEIAYAATERISNWGNIESGKTKFHNSVKNQVKGVSRKKKNVIEKGKP